MVFNSVVPGDAPILANPNDADCFGWAEFIALNWPTTSGAGFGDPRDLGAVQWETYMPMELLFQPGGGTPPAWGSQPTIPPDCQTLLQQDEQAKGQMAAVKESRGVKVIAATSKFTAGGAQIDAFPSIISEAAPQNAPNWLGAQNSTNLWYEVRINQDEYNYVVANQLYNPQGQANWVNGGQGKPILLPKGQVKGNVGAIELKAAWMETAKLPAAKLDRYKLSPGIVIDPVTGQCRATTLALIGLHIIHKTESQPTWIWATFEHVDNVPGAPNGEPPYNLYNPNCQPSPPISVPEKWLGPKVTSPVTVTCGANTPPPYYLGQGGPGPVPIQVTRVTPLAPEVQATNKTIHEAIVKNYPKSVWQYYQLVNVLWSTSPTLDPTTPLPVPLHPSNLFPQPAVPVANTTMETYVQTKTCTDCHSFAAIAKLGKEEPKWNSDFSFAFSTATGSPPPQPPGR